MTYHRAFAIQIDDRKPMVVMVETPIVHCTISTDPFKDLREYQEAEQVGRIMLELFDKLGISDVEIAEIKDVIIVTRPETSPDFEMTCEPWDGEE
jgi:hypothetical protein